MFSPQIRRFFIKRFFILIIIESVGSNYFFKILICESAVYFISLKRLNYQIQVYVFWLSTTLNKWQELQIVFETANLLTILGNYAISYIADTGSSIDRKLS